MLGSRVTSQLDVGRVGEAISRPGIDTRTWVSLAVVTAVNVDPAHGVFVDIVLLPSGLEETASVASEYAGPGYGFYTPYAVDDEVVVVAPHGDPEFGLIVVRRMWGAGTGTPPAIASSNPNDAALVLNTNVNMRIITQGAGNVILEPQGAGKVMLGGEENLRAASGVGDSVATGVAALVTALSPFFVGTLSPPPPTGSVSGSITSGSPDVEIT